MQQRLRASELAVESFVVPLAAAASSGTA